MLDMKAKNSLLFQTENLKLVIMLNYENKIR